MTPWAPPHAYINSKQEMGKPSLNAAEPDAKAEGCVHGDPSRADTWQQIEIDDMQFGFMKGKGATDAIFMARHMQENFRIKDKKLYFGFVDLEKAFDRVPREVISWELKNG